MEFSQQEYWSGLPCPPPADLPDPGIELGSPALQVDTLPSEPDLVSSEEGMGKHFHIFKKKKKICCNLGWKLQWG